jgi:hypothetical protein
MNEGRRTDRPLQVGRIEAPWLREEAAAAVAGLIYKLQQPALITPCRLAVRIVRYYRQRRPFFNTQMKSDAAVGNQTGSETDRYIRLLLAAVSPWFSRRSIEGATDTKLQ